MRATHGFMPQGIRKPAGEPVNRKPARGPLNRWSWVLGCVLLLGSVHPVRAQRPNILLIQADDLCHGDLGFYGNPTAQTPHLDKLAAESVRLDQFHGNSLSAASRAALLTGRYSIRTGVRGENKGAEALLPRETTIAEMLKSAGWRTAYFGEWLNGDHWPYVPGAQGFDANVSFYSDNTSHFDTRMRAGNDGLETRGYVSDVLTDVALRFMEENQATPWFCQVAFPVPHSPLQCPQKEFEAAKELGLSDELAAIQGMVANLDTNIGRLLGQIDQMQIAHKTVVIFVSDNGPANDRYNDGMRGLAGSHYLGGIRVPCMIRWTDRLAARAVPQIVAHIDILPTIAGLCGVRIPEAPRVDGVNLMPLLEDNAPNWPEREIFIANAPKGNSGRMEGSVRTQQYHAVNATGSWELYNLTFDPGESMNVARAEYRELRALTTKFDAWGREVMVDLPPIPKPIPVGYDAWKTVELSASRAELLGNVQWSEKDFATAWLRVWSGKRPRAIWEVDVQQAGPYEVTAIYGCEVPDRAKIVVTSGSQKIEMPLPMATTREVPAKDRVPRTAGFEREWARLTLGKVQWAEGKQSIAVEVPGGNSTFLLKHLELRRIDEE